MKKILALLFVFLYSQNFPQQASNWKIYTSMSTINDFVISNNAIWGATTGGAFEYNPINKTYKKFTKVEGMTGINITATSLDNSGNVWFGSSNGALDVLNTATLLKGTIPDILNSDQTNKQINSLQTSGDTVIAATDFGITLIDPKNKVLYDTFFKFDFLTSNSKINYAIKYDLIYAASDNGVIIQKPGTTNLSAPESWTVYSLINGLPSNTINKIIKYGDSIIAATDKGLSKYNGIGFENYLPQLNNNNITDLYINNDTLFILTNNLNVYSFANGNLVNVYNFPTLVNNIVINSSYGILGSSASGIIQMFNQQITNIAPNGPFANRFIDLGVDNDGTLWAGSGTSAISGVGFYSLHNDFWTNYNTTTTPILPTNLDFKVYCAPDNSTYIGSWGNGFVKIKNNNIQVFSKAVTGMTGIDVDTNFVVCSGFAQDSKNNLWILNFGSVTRRNLTLLTKDSTYYHFLIPATSNIYLKNQIGLVIDQYDTKWYVSQGTRAGLIYFNENNTLNDPSDDKSNFVSNLNSPSVNTVVVDKRGDLWVGTSLGVNIITNTFTIATLPNPQLSISSVFILRQQNINCIMVDPLNQKWVGTNQGLFLVNDDGTELITVYDSKNSPLLSDVILNLAIDPNTGTVYVGTDAGLISLKTTSVKPLDSFSGLRFYPSPFRLSKDNNNLTIDGLIADTDIKILTISGKLVREFSSPGGRIANWDGRNDNGTLVNSGIYLIIAYDKEGNNVASGKIAILRQ
jgi:ligand-binding sensor domain-containing protein